MGKSSTVIGAISAAMPSVVPIIDAALGFLEERKLLSLKAELIMAKQQSEINDAIADENGKMAKSLWHRCNVLEIENAELKRQIINAGMIPVSIKNNSDLQEAIS